MCFWGMGVYLICMLYIRSSGKGFTVLLGRGLAVGSGTLEGLIWS